MKSILSIQDLSCVGRCSLTIALPVLSALGHRCSVLPTAVLSTHTGFPQPEIVPLTHTMHGIARHWERIGVCFDAVTCGYLAGPEQVDTVVPILKHYRSLGSRIIVDPAMGDHGRLYSGLGDSHVQAMAQLCLHAHVLLPNITEAALLTGNVCPDSTDTAAIKALASALLVQFPADAVIITGVSGENGTIGFIGMHRQTGSFAYHTQVVPRQFHGTGDLFAAVFAGKLLLGASYYDAAVCSADFVHACVDATPGVTPFGVDFEGQLSQLFP